MADQTLDSGLSDNAASGLAYITFIPAIVFLVTAPYNQNATVRFHAWQSIFLNVAWFLVWMGLVVLGMIPFVNYMDVVLMPLAMLGFLVLWILIVINAFSGKRFRVPLLSELAEKQAGAGR